MQQAIICFLRLILLIEQHILSKKHTDEGLKSESGITTMNWIPSSVVVMASILLLLLLLSIKYIHKFFWIIDSILLDVLEYVVIDTRMVSIPHNHVSSKSLISILDICPIQ